MCNIVPIDDVPECGDVICLHILVVEIESVLPHVELEDRDCSLGRVALLVKELLDNQARPDGIPGQNPPA